MSGVQTNRGHTAEAAALGFYYQAFYALLILLGQETDQAAIGIEQLDDIELKADGRTLLLQLKHSISTTPAPITIRSRALWRTIKVWIDALPSVSLSETSFHLVTVGGIGAGDLLVNLLSHETDRATLHEAMVVEAQRVVDERAAAKVKKQTALPHADRVDGCEAFLDLPETMRLNLLRRSIIRPDSPSIEIVEELVAAGLKIVPPDQRPPVAKRLIEWWDREVIYSLCGKRNRFIFRVELQQSITAFIGEIEQDKLLAEFESLHPPEDYQPNGMLARQVQLVRGKPSDLTKATREEWRAREQRSKWVNDDLRMASVVGEYDHILQEHWADRHGQVVEDCVELKEEDKCASGLALLRWTHDEAPTLIRPIREGWNAPYYVRGSYQVLAINLQVGWHPDFAALLGEKK